MFKMKITSMIWFVFLITLIKSTVEAVNTGDSYVENVEEELEKLIEKGPPLTLPPAKENKTEKPELVTWSHQEMTIFIPGGKFKMGVNDPTSKTGEYPVRKTEVGPFKIDKYPVTNADFWHFKRLKGKYRTGADKKGWSYVFYSFASKKAEKVLSKVHSDQPWWFPIRGARWDRPEGIGSNVIERGDFPVVHVSWQDAYAYCQWRGRRLPTEMEWEYAARGGQDGKRYPWGEHFQLNRMNTWQGLFPSENRGADGWQGVSPVHAFKAQNDYELYDMVGNVWEWTQTPYDGPNLPKDHHETWYVTKGASFVDTRDGRLNHEARCAARQGFHPTYTAQNVGFRCAQTVNLMRYKPKGTEATRPPRQKQHRKKETWTAKVVKNPWLKGRKLDFSRYRQEL